MPIRKSHPPEKSLSLRLPVPGKRKVLFVMAVLAAATCVAGGAGAHMTPEEDARPCAWQPPFMRCHTPGDYDGDHKADLAVFRPGEGVWYVLRSSNDQLNAVQWGLMNDRLVSADYDGDRKEDFAVYRKPVGTWWILYSSTGQWYSRQFGYSDAEPAPADYDGDGKADLAFSRGGEYRILMSTGANEETTDRLLYTSPESNHNDINVPGDYDGDGRADRAILHDPNPEVPDGEEAHPESRIWIIRFSSTQQTGNFTFGEVDDVPVPGDYNGDGRTDIAVWRPKTGTWHIIENLAEGASLVAREVRWGMEGDKVAPGDYDGDGKTDVAVWRPSDGVWYIINSSTDAYNYPHWGQSGDIPIPMSLKRHEH
ncbi:MAG TPA: VCBS repeat-containing protein [Pyrinomonadaceae bacterium]